MQLLIWPWLGRLGDAVGRWPWVAHEVEVHVVHVHCHCKLFADQMSQCACRSCVFALTLRVRDRERHPPTSRMIFLIREA